MRGERHSSRLPFRRLIGVIVAATTLIAVLPAGAAAAPPCSTPTQSNVLLQGQGLLESVIVDDQGRLFFTNPSGIVRLDAPGGAPQFLAPILDPGGLAFDSDGMLVVGSGNTIPNGTTGDLLGPAKLFKVNPDTGAQVEYASGLSMGNGLARGPDGSFYASNDVGMNIDRIRLGVTERGWAHVLSGNGLAIDSAGKYLYVAQTLQPAAIKRVDLSTAAVTPYVNADAADITAGLDGLARDGADRIFAAALNAGQIWRVEGTPPEICVLLDGLATFPDGPSAVATGQGITDFPATNLYAVTFDGKLIELVDVATPPAMEALPSSATPRIDLTVRPRRPRAGRTTRLRFKATVQGSGLAGATVRLGGKSTTTNSAGRARIVSTFSAPGRRTARVKLSGYLPGKARIRVR